MHNQTLTCKEHHSIILTEFHVQHLWVTKPNFVSMILEYVHSLGSTHHSLTTLCFDSYTKIITIYNICSNKGGSCVSNRPSESRKISNRDITVSLRTYNVFGVERTHEENKPQPQHHSQVMWSLTADGF